MAEPTSPYYPGVKTALVLEEEMWYKIKAGAVVEIEQVDKDGDTVKGKTKYFKTLSPIVFQLGGGQKIQVEEVK